MVAREFVPKIMQLIAKDVDPQSICRIIRLCPRAQVSLLAASAQVAAERRQLQVGDNCALCKLVVRQVEAELLQNKTEQEIVDLITHDLCPLLGSLQAEVRTRVIVLIPDRFDR